jgi:hypothetical protein
MIYTGRDNVPIGTWCTRHRMQKQPGGGWRNVRLVEALTRENRSD